MAKLPAAKEVQGVLAKNPAMRAVMAEHPGSLELLERAGISGERIEAIAGRLQRAGSEQGLRTLRDEIVEALSSFKGNLKDLERVTALKKSLDDLLAPPELHFDDLVNAADAGAFRFRLLNELYQRHLKAVRKTADEVGLKQWAQVTRSKYAKALFEALLGSDWHKKVGRKRNRLIPIHILPAPRWPEREMEAMAALFNEHLSELTSKLGRLLDRRASKLTFRAVRELTGQRLLPEWIMNQLKGKMAEVLCHEHMMGILRGLDKNDKELVKRLGGEPEEFLLCKDIRYDYRTGSSLDDAIGDALNKSKEFTDGMILARMKDGSYRVVHIFEVKSGSQGAEEARKQVFKNRESIDDVERITNVSTPKRTGGAGAEAPDPERVIGAVYRADGMRVEGMSLDLTYERGKPGADTVSGLFRADKTILAPADELAELPGVRLSQAEQDRLAAYARGEDISIDDIMARISRLDDRNTNGITSINPIRTPDGALMTREDILHLAAYVLSQSFFVNIYRALG